MRETISRAPCRIDLAGGTIDLTPLFYYLHPHEVQHFAIDLYAKCKITSRPAQSTSLNIYSREYQTNKKFSSLKRLKNSLNNKKNQLSWPCRIADYFFEKYKIKKQEVNIELASDIPPGSGLGGSSVLGVAIYSALEKHFFPKTRSNKWATQSILRNLESQELGFPAGEQDYVPALFGGLLSFHLGMEKFSVSKFSNKSKDELNKRICLIYTGKPHHSGLNNWQVYRDFHEGNQKVRNSLEKLSSISTELKNSLSSHQWKKFGKILNKEWEHRQKLSSKIDAAVFRKIKKDLKQFPHSALKGCGAGGGGCALIYFANPNDQEKFCQNWQIPKDHQLIKPRIVTQGVQTRSR